MLFLCMFVADKRSQTAMGRNLLLLISIYPEKWDTIYCSRFQYTLKSGTQFTVQDFNIPEVGRNLLFMISIYHYVRHWCSRRNDCTLKLCATKLRFVTKIRYFKVKNRGILKNFLASPSSWSFGVGRLHEFQFPMPLGLNWSPESTSGRHPYNVIYFCILNWKRSWK